MASPSFVKQRSLARRRAMQAIYQWQMAGNDLKEIETQYLTEQDMSKVDVDYFIELMHKVPQSIDVLDAAAEKHMDQTMEKTDPIERAIIRLSVYELMQRLDVPYKVVINEAIILAKAFGGENSHTFVNGIVDKTAHDLRQTEIK
ncbi:MAG: transcription antitermination factor NusB [Gammaproteobacteria bacterium]|nr:transcription antitermination factor NusB [Gammaproteobacteria bacterium]